MEDITKLIIEGIYKENYESAVNSIDSSVDLNKEWLCLKCKHKWKLKNKSKMPKECPSCGSIKWNLATKEVECKRCGKKFNIKQPETKSSKCSKCGSKLWNYPKEMLECRVCLAKWELKGKKYPKSCPKCGSTVWNDPEVDIDLNKSLVEMGENLEDFRYKRYENLE